MKAIIKFKRYSPQYLQGETERIVEDLTEIHYCFTTVIDEPMTAFESSIHSTGFNLFNAHIQEIEITI